jgi:hypothetical protein
MFQIPEYSNFKFLTEKHSLLKLHTMKMQQLLKVAGAALLLSAGTWACKSLDENPDFANPGAF